MLRRASSRWSRARVQQPFQPRVLMGSLTSKPAPSVALSAEVAALVPGSGSTAPVASPLGGRGHGLQLPVPLLEGGRYANPANWGFVEKGFTDVMKWKREGGPPRRPSEQEIREATGHQQPDLAAWASPAAVLDACVDDAQLEEEEELALADIPAKLPWKVDA